MKGIKNIQASYNNKKAQKSTYILGNFITLHSTIAPTPFRVCIPQVVVFPCLSDPATGKERSLCFKSNPPSFVPVPIYKPLEHSRIFCPFIQRIHVKVKWERTLQYALYSENLWTCKHIILTQRNISTLLLS